MKALDIALKDMTQSFRSFFAVAFMFGVPILVTGMFYFMLGPNVTDEGMTIPPTKVQIVNLDVGSELFLAMMGSADLAGMPGEIDVSQVRSMGDIFIAVLSSPDFSKIISLTIVQDEASARAAVDAQQAGVAVIIPPDFTEAIMDPEARATIQVYQDPTLTIGPGIVKALLSQMIEMASGTRICAEVALEQLADAGVVVDAARIQDITMQVERENQGRGALNQLLEVRTPNGGSASATGLNIIGLVLGGMMVFFGFFTGASTAESILREDERGTLSRLLATPTRSDAILGGKLLAVAVTLLVQISFLMLFGWLVFRIQWGHLSAVILAGASLVILAGTSGIFLVSLIKNTRQAGLIFGGVMTITGMIGVMNVFTMNAPGSNPAVEKMALVVPQGWAMRSLSLAMEGASFGELLPWFGGALLWSLVFFVLGNLRLRRRFV
jgi:ABC-2 type transport system permease protein